MKIILLEDIDKLGTRGETNEVKTGYAINFLFPKKLATSLNSKEAKGLIDSSKKEAEKKTALMDELKHKFDQITKSKIVIKKKTNAKGNYFGAVAIKELNELAGITKELEKYISWPEIEKPGEYKGQIKLDDSNLDLVIEAKPELKK